MSHVDAAVQEMLRDPLMQLLGNCCRLEKVLLAGLVIESRATGPYIPSTHALAACWSAVIPTTACLEAATVLLPDREIVKVKKRLTCPMLLNKGLYPHCVGHEACPAGKGCADAPTPAWAVCRVRGGDADRRVGAHAHPVRAAPRGGPPAHWRRGLRRRAPRRQANLLGGPGQRPPAHEVWRSSACTMCDMQREQPKGPPAA